VCWLQFHEFPAVYEWNQALDFGVDDAIVDDMRKRRQRLVSVESVVQFLTEMVLCDLFRPEITRAY
jgi:hypothetical protein